MFKCTQCGEYVEDEKVVLYSHNNYHNVHKQTRGLEEEIIPCRPLEKVTEDELLSITNDLKKLHAYIKKDDMEDWGNRRGSKKLTPPYPADAPCYYCMFKEDSIGKKACNYCIHNPDAIIYKLPVDG